MFILSFWQLLHTNMTRSVCLREIHFEVSSFLHILNISYVFQFASLGQNFWVVPRGISIISITIHEAFSCGHSCLPAVMMPLRQLANLFLDFFKSEIIYYIPKKWCCSNCSSDASPMDDDDTDIEMCR